MAIVHVTDSDFAGTIAKDELVLVDFWATWCGPCQRIAPMLEEIDNEGALPVTIAKLNVDENPNTTAQHGIMSIPTLKLFKGGVEVDTMVGLRPIDAIKEWIQKNAV